MSRFRYNGEFFEPNEVHMTRVERASILSPRGKKLISLQRLFLEIVVVKSSVADLTSRINAIQALFENNYGDAVLYTDDAGTVQSSHYLLNSTSLSGVRVVRGPVFDRADGGEYANKRTAIVTLEASYDTSDGDLVSWRERLAFIGTGGPDYAVINTFSGPVAYQIGSASPQTIIQAGEAVGFAANVAAPAMLYPSGSFYVRADQQRVEYGSGLMLGQAARYYPTSWQYVSIAATPQIGLPTTR